MGTLSGMMHVATSALAADQAALRATADNISNQNTVGYTRRVVQWGAGDTVDLGGGTSSSTGVSATVRALRDRVLQRSVQQATAVASASSSRLSALNSLQSLFAPSASGDDASGIGAALTTLFTAATSFAAQPTDGLSRQTLLASMQSLASRFNQAAADVAALGASLNQSVAASVGEVNGLATQIAAFNKQLAQAPAGETAGSLLDQRDALVTRLSQLVDLHAVRGANETLSVSLADGTPLVSDTNVMELHTAVVSGTVRVYSAAAAGGSDVTSAIRGGSMGGALQARDEDLPAELSKLDLIASSISSSVNMFNVAGLLPSGAHGGPIFSGGTAATITVVATNASAFATGGSGVNATAMGGLGGATVGGPMVAGQPTITEFYASVLSDLGQTAANAKTADAANTAVLTQVSAQMEDASGVSLDQEAANLTQYQRSYQAAAKVLAIVNELMAQAINLGQSTSVS